MEAPSAEEEVVADSAAASDSAWLHDKTKEIEEIERILRTCSEKPENKQLIGKAHSSDHLKSQLKTMFRI
jgi:hypothetical protein